MIASKVASKDLLEEALGSILSPRARPPHSGVIAMMKVMWIKLSSRQCFMCLVKKNKLRITLHVKIRRGHIGMFNDIKS